MPDSVFLSRGPPKISRLSLPSQQGHQKAETRLVYSSHTIGLLCTLASRKVKQPSSKNMQQQECARFLFPSFLSQTYRFRLAVERERRPAPFHTTSVPFSYIQPLFGPCSLIYDRLTSNCIRFGSTGNQRTSFGHRHQLRPADHLLDPPGQSPTWNGSRTRWWRCPGQLNRAEVREEIQRSIVRHLGGAKFPTSNKGENARAMSECFNERGFETVC